MDRVLATLARWRVSLGLPVLVVSLWLATPTRASLAWGAVLAVAGEALRLLAAGHLRKGREVTASGPYRWLAHPLYVGSSLMGAGFAVAARSIAAAALVIAYLATTVIAAVRTEEAFLRRQFGDRYDRYRRGETGADLDRGRGFSFAQAMANREYSAIAGLAAIMALLVLKAAW